MSVPAQIYYRFDDLLDMEEIAATLTLALLATEAIHGALEVCLNVPYQLDCQEHACRIPADTEIGRDLNKVFAGLLVREFGTGSFRGERIDADTLSPQSVPA